MLPLQAALVSSELIRTAILWHEQWHTALEEASRFYFGAHDVEGMLPTLEPLHAKLSDGPETSREAIFLQVIQPQTSTPKALWMHGSVGFAAIASPRFIHRDWFIATGSSRLIDRDGLIGVH